MTDPRGEIEGRVAIRPALPGDAPDLGRLSTQLGYPMSGETSRRRLDEIGSGEDDALFVAADASGVLGWIQVEVSRVFETPRQAEILGLIVDENARGAGIGRRLVAAAEAWARGRACAVIRVRSNVIRERAHAFYAREGYGEIKKQRVFEKSLGRS